MEQVSVSFTQYYNHDKNYKTYSFNIKPREKLIAIEKTALPNRHNWSGIERHCSNNEYLFVFERFGKDCILVYIYSLFGHRLVNIRYIPISNDRYFNVEDCLIGENEHFYIYISNWCSMEEEGRQIVLFETDKDFNVVNKQPQGLERSFCAPVIDLGMQFIANYWINNFFRRINEKEIEEVTERAKNLINNTPDQMKQFSKLTYLPYSKKILMSSLDLNQQPFYLLEGSTQRFMLNGEPYEFVERPDQCLIGVGTHHIVLVM